MASLERTAYPVLSRSYSRAELQREFSFSEEEVTWVKSRSNAAFRLNLAVLFKTLRIPRHPATQSALIWPGIPRPSGHLF
ncbi:DUF4158 domain-containing protein, partial [Pseudomonas aeruginosa]|nr:DUF4158 domain-containing protein [Pseudomonas aeruginosa]MCS7852969.1 DUF4158 domain-containing protein [Pseudomonas aeruginosa]